MITRYRAWLDGQGLQDVDPSVVITDVQEAVPDMQLETAEHARGDGMRILRNTRRSLSVSIRFMIAEYDVERRKAIMEKVITWARRGGTLTINDRPGQQLAVVPEQLPCMASALRWLNELTLVFTAFDFPFWQEAIPVRVSGYGTQGQLWLFPSGNRETCVLEARITNAGTDVLSTVTIEANGRSITFTQLALEPGGELSMTLEHGVLNLPVPNRTAESADEILLECGKHNAIYFTADQSVSAVFSARGAWL